MAVGPGLAGLAQSEAVGRGLSAALGAFRASLRAVLVVVGIRGSKTIEQVF